MSDAVLERWTPDPRYARLRPPHLLFIPLLLILVAVTWSTNASSASIAFIVFAIAGWIVVSYLRSHRRVLVDDVCFELTSTEVRVRMGDAVRSLPLHEVRDVRVERTERRANVGHVVIHSCREHEPLPTILPTGRRVSGGTVGLVTWATVEHVDPTEQLFEGAMTLWFVSRPDVVRDRILAAVRCLPPHARGPHR